MDGRAPGERPFTLMDYFDYAPRRRRRAGIPRYDPATRDSPNRHDPARRPNYRDWLLVIDESHVTMPQVRAMYNGDRARKEVLVEHGFRLPSALDNRPLRFEEFESIVPQALYVSATPSKYELERTGGEVAEQVIRPPACWTPTSRVKPTKGQVPDLVEQCHARVKQGERVLVTRADQASLRRPVTVPGREGPARPLSAQRHRDARPGRDPLRPAAGELDVLVGVNLLREGLDLPDGLSCRDSRRRQGGVPPLPHEPHSAHGTRGPERQRQGHHVRRPGNPGDAERPSKKPSAGASSSWPTTQSTTSRPPRSRRPCGAGWPRSCGKKDGARGGAHAGARVRSRRADPRDWKRRCSRPRRRWHSKRPR